MSKFRILVENILTKNTLIEGKQVGLLYHATDLRGFIGICKSDAICSWRPNGISFSRDRHTWYGLSMFTFILDGDKVSDNHKVYPFSFHSYFPSEHPPKDTNAENSVLPRGMKAGPKPEYYNDIFGNTEYKLTNIHKYIVGLLINNYEVREKVIMPDAMSCQDDGLMPKMFTLEKVMTYCENLFKKSFPNKPIKYVNDKPTDRDSIEKWRTSHNIK